MLETFRQIFAKPRIAPLASVAEGQRVYAVGDIHGRLDLFEAILAAIEADDRASGPADTTVVLLGDLVDRGPASAGVLSLAREWREYRRVRILAGNHEEMFLRSFDDVNVLRHFLRHGGRETILSYGISRERYRKATIEEVQALMHEAVPADHIEFIAGFEDYVELGDYLFVHAGIAPGVPVGEQKMHDLRWIREPFLSHSAPHSAVVVHGHTITDDAEDHGNRIALDTGAFRSGRLTALVLEGSTRRYIRAEEGPDHTIHTEHFER